LPSNPPCKWHFQYGDTRDYITVTKFQLQKDAYNPWSKVFEEHYKHNPEDNQSIGDDEEEQFDWDCYEHGEDQMEQDDGPTVNSFDEALDILVVVDAFPDNDANANRDEFNAQQSNGKGKGYGRIKHSNDRPNEQPYQAPPSTQAFSLIYERHQTRRT